MTSFPVRTVSLGLAAFVLGGFVAVAWQRGLDVSGVSSTSVASPAADVPGRPISPVLISAFESEKGAARWLKLLAASEEATAREMPGLIRAAGKDGAAIRMLAARWAELDPMHMFRTLHGEYLVAEDAPGALPERSALMDILIESWCAANPAAVVKTLNDVPNFSQREQLRMRAASQLIKTDVERGLTAMSDWNIRNYLPDLKAVGAWAAKDPARAAEVVAKLGHSAVGREALTQVGKAWAATDPQGALQKAASLPFFAGITFAGQIVGDWAARDLKSAERFTTQIKDPAMRNAAGLGLAKAWAKTDPAAAVAWSNENLRGAARAEAVGGVIKALAEKDIRAAAELASGLEGGALQSRACASIFETWFDKGASSREAAFEWLAGIEDAAVRSAALETVQWKWVWTEPAGVKEFIAGKFGYLASEAVVNNVARNQGMRDPEAAWKWAESLAEDRRTGASQAVLTSWLSIRPEAAADFVRKMEAGAKRDQAIQTVAQHLVWQSPQLAGKWWKGLGPADRKVVREIYDRYGLPADQKAQLENALSTTP